MSAIPQQAVPAPVKERFPLAPPQGTHIPQWDPSSASVDGALWPITTYAHVGGVTWTARRTVSVPSGPWGTVSVVASEVMAHDAKFEALRRARAAIRAAIIEQTPDRVVFDEDALRRGYELLVAAQPEWEENSVCGRLSVGFPIRGEDYEDAPNED